MYDGTLLEELTDLLMRNGCTVNKKGMMELTDFVVSYAKTAVGSLHAAFENMERTIDSEKSGEDKDGKS